MLKNALKGFLNLPYLIMFLFLVIFSCTALVTLMSYYDYQYARSSVDKVRQFYIDKIDKTNTYNVNQIPIDNTAIKDLMTTKKSFTYTSFGDIKVDIKVDSGSSNKDSGYFGRTATVTVSRQVETKYLGIKYTVKSVGSTVNRGHLNPSKDLNYNLGDEFFDNTNGNGRK